MPYVDFRKIVWLPCYVCPLQLCSKCSLLTEHAPTHSLLVSCSQSIQIETCLLMCAVWLLNSWPWHSYLHLICSPSVREHYLIIFHAVFVFAHHHHLKAPHENRELIAPRWPSCHIYLRPSLWQLQLSLTKLIVCVVSSQRYAGSQSLV
jgi:hypothetical protein